MIEAPVRRLAGALLLICAIAGCQPATPPQPARTRTIIVGLDGFDPVLAERAMAEGRLPNLARLREQGHYQRLETTNPPQSPVAWASFATGHGPGAHGIFDFLRRKPGSYAIDFSIAEQTPPAALTAFGWRLPFGDGELRNRRGGTPFWLAAEADGRRANVFRVPVTYPPDPVSGMIAGMGVPDLLGSQGTYTILATRPIAGADSGGRVVLSPVETDGAVHTQLDGPIDPLRSDGRVLALPLHLAPAAHGAQLTLGDASTALKTGVWSDWIRVRFDLGLAGSIGGMLRARLAEGFPRPLLYLSPIQADPRDPALPISAPPSFAAALAERIGDFHTLGMPEETWALNQGHLDEDGWLDMVATTLAEGEAMLYDALDRRESELVVEVFVQPDRVSHMFWHTLDPAHPRHAGSSERARRAIDDIYDASDRIVGEVLARMTPDDRLIVLSDHGFASFRRAVHLNRWLHEHGYLALKSGADPQQPLFAAVDWPHTRAFALGLNGLYLNVQGREPEGSVAPAEVPALKAALRDALRALRDPADDAAIVHEVYDGAALYPGAHVDEAPDLVIGYAAGYRASWQTSLGALGPALVEDNLQHWSGDHCIDPAAVPGVLFSSQPLERPLAGIGDLAALVLGRDAAAP